MIQYYFVNCSNYNKMMANKKTEKLTSDYILKEMEIVHTIIANNFKPKDPNVAFTILWGKTGTGKSTATILFSGQ